MLCRVDSPWPYKNPGPCRLRRPDCHGNDEKDLSKDILKTIRRNCDQPILTAIFVVAIRRWCVTIVKLKKIGFFPISIVT